ncbi:LptA/OstA family protein [uncultured Sphingorhabdus sp.]|uniref:LptA/OstA family protein n=1 Tax=uncultured Sphingorhabdus sp. TaxID=1686106 RepID=UPI002625D685|nr:LptA/OstA family protein [uncultured Sphingorhabdus sp.]HMS19511.1 LptA/OstA family protein [Sphingorhabdus sp.]
MSKTFLPILLTSALGTAALLSVAAPAQVIRNHNSNAPVDFDAGAIELQDRADRVILTGGVTATQAGLTMRASRVTAAYTSNGGIDVNRLDAVGGGTITKDDLRATSDAAIYDLGSNLITLIGNVRLTQGTNRLSGGRIVIDLNAGRSTITGGASAPGTTGKNGRVTGTFTVPQRKN